MVSPCSGWSLRLSAGLCFFHVIPVFIFYHLLFSFHLRLWWCPPGARSLVYPGEGLAPAPLMLSMGIPKLNKPNPCREDPEVGKTGCNGLVGICGAFVKHLIVLQGRKSHREGKQCSIGWGMGWRLLYLPSYPQQGFRLPAGSQELGRAVGGGGTPLQCIQGSEACLKWGKLSTDHAG